MMISLFAGKAVSLPTQNKHTMDYAIIAAGEGSRLVQEGMKTPKPLLRLHGVYSFDLHPVSPPLALGIFVDLHNAKKGNGMLSFQVPSGNIFSHPTASSALTGTHRFCWGADVMSGNHLTILLTTSSVQMAASQFIVYCFYPDNYSKAKSRKIGRAHVWTPVTHQSRMPSSAWKKKKKRQ